MIVIAPEGLHEADLEARGAAPWVGGEPSFDADVVAGEQAAGVAGQRQQAAVVLAQHQAAAVRREIAVDVGDVWIGGVCGVCAAARQGEAGGEQQRRYQDPGNRSSVVSHESASGELSSGVGSAAVAVPR